MAEYVEREAMIEKINREKRLLNSAFPKRKLCVGDVLDCIFTAPAADVVEVRHGAWVGDAFCDVLTCKECSYEHALYVLGKLSATNYCPNCGAKMDGKGE